MRAPILLCFDPGFAACGFAIIRILAQGEALDDLGVLSTVKTAKKQRRLAVDDNVRRTRELFSAFDRLLHSRVGHVYAIAAEAQSHGSGAGGAAVGVKIGLVWGALICAAHHVSVPIMQPSPQDIRQALGLGKITIRRGASTKERDEARKNGKLETERVVCARFPNAAALLDQLNKGDRNHAVDALAAGIACLDSELVQVLRTNIVAEGSNDIQADPSGIHPALVD